MRILFFGDIVGKIGRRALAEIIPQAREELKPDIVIANAENVAHGMGITRKTLAEARVAGVEAFTSGNHISDKDECAELLTDPSVHLIRPANFPPAVPGRGYMVLEVGTRSLAVINLMGRVFMHEHCDCPFRTFDAIMQDPAVQRAQVVIVDFHGEATSEKAAFGWHVDGRVAAVVGTHTHIPTADHHVLPGGSAYVSDVGMVGGRDGVIGMKREGPLKGFLTQLNVKFDVIEAGVATVNTVVIDADPGTGRATAIARYDREISIV